MIDSTLFDKEMSIRGFVQGALELYVNGELAGTAGKIGETKESEEVDGYFKPIVFRFSNQPEQALANNKL